MHYPRTAFSKNNLETITPTDPNAQIGQRTGLSAGDIAAVKIMYPSCGVVKLPYTEPIKKIRDDIFPFKKFRDDNRVKKLRDDIVVKHLRDPKLPRDPGPIKFSRDLRPVGRPGIVTQPGTLQPFATVTPHHAALAMGMPGEAESSAYAASLQQQFLDLEAANAEIGRLQEESDAISAALEELGAGG
jgi:hypothetical protein